MPGPGLVIALLVKCFAERLVRSMFDLLIIGAGPCGLAAAAAAKKNGLNYVAFDKGTIVDSITRYPTGMTFFSTSDKLAIADVPFITLRPNPTREEAMEYYRQVAASLDLNIRQYEEVIDIQQISDGFTVTTRRVLRPDLPAATYHTRRLVMATGSYHHPNRLGVPGEDLPNVSHYFDEPHRYYRQRVVVVGGRNSAVEAALQLLRAGAQVTLVHRGADLSDRVKPWLLPFIRNRIEDGSIKAHFQSRVVEIRPDRVVIESGDRRFTVEHDFTLLLTGYRPDHGPLVKLGVAIDPDTGCPEYNPETMETNVPGLYIAGVLAAGFDANKIFIENGRFHGRLIADHVASQLGR